MKWEDMGMDGRHALEMVGGRLYKLDPHQTLIHEIIGNANDEFEKGLTNDPTISITFEKYENGEFYGMIIFKNNAPPISPSFFEKDYHTMFKSSKSEESGGIGFVGIGAKQFLQSKPQRELITITGNDQKSLLASIWQWPEIGNPQVGKTPQNSYDAIIGSRKVSHEQGTTFVANLTKEEFDDLKQNLNFYLQKWWNHALLNNVFKISVSGNDVSAWIPHNQKYERPFFMSSKKIKCTFFISDAELNENDENFPHILYVVGEKRIADKTVRDTHRIIKNYAKRIFCYADVSPLLKKYVLMSKEDFQEGNPYVSKQISGALIALKILSITILAFFIIFSGCSQNHRVFIAPSILIHNSTIGKGLPVSVKVIDSRPNNVISKWEDGFKLRKFTIISQGDLKEIFRNRTRRGLTKLGFMPKKFNLKSDRSLKIEILNIKSHYQEDPPKINVRVKANIKATCILKFS